MNKDKSYVLHSGSLYDYSAGVHCGVLVKERVMKKLAALQARHLEEVKKILADGAGKGDVFPSEWTLHHPDGKHTNVHYIDTEASVKERIKNACISKPPIHRGLVFISKTMEEAAQMADSWNRNSQLLRKIS